MVNEKQSRQLIKVFCFKQGSEMNGFCLKQGQGLKASAAHPTQTSLPGVNTLGQFEIAIASPQ